MADILIDARIYGGGVNLSGQSNKVELAVEADEIDATVFQPDNPTDRGWKARRGGVLDSKASFSGFWDAGDPSAVDNGMWAGLGTVTAWSFIRGTGAVGDIAWSTRALESKYSFLGEHGRAAPFDGTVTGAWPMVRGRVAHPPTIPRGANGTGTAVPFPAAVPSRQYLYAALHVLSVAGTSTPALTVAVESDDEPDFPAPAQRLAFAAATGIGGQMIRAAGPFTDTHYRLRWGVTGAAASFLFAATLAVAPA